MPRKNPPASSALAEPTYNVGYGKPPKYTQFKPGHSGNPSGRPRGQQNFKTVIEQALNEKITIREGDRTRKVSRREAIIRKILSNALQGDYKAIASLIQVVRSTGLMGEEAETTTTPMRTEDDAIVAEFLERQGIISGAAAGVDLAAAAEGRSPKPAPGSGTDGQ